mmetsp:Transcript_2508/g.7141  ORF Transcript_2508/g.7141 Transcript_2508/m.7141 type:complete len:496 (+) Transcript_2508:1313-2800(+)
MLRRQHSVGDGVQHHRKLPCDCLELAHHCYELCSRERPCPDEPPAIVVAEEDAEHVAEVQEGLAHAVQHLQLRGDARLVGHASCVVLDGPTLPAMRPHRRQVGEDVPSTLAHDAAAALEAGTCALDVALRVISGEACDGRGHVNDDRETRKAPCDQGHLPKYGREHLDDPDPGEKQRRANLLCGYMHQVLELRSWLAIEELKVLLQHLAVHPPLQLQRERLLCPDHCDPRRKLKQLLDDEDEKTIPNRAGELPVALIPPASHAARSVRQSEHLQRRWRAHQDLEDDAGGQPHGDLRVQHLAADVPLEAPTYPLLLHDQALCTTQLVKELLGQCSWGPPDPEGLRYALRLLDGVRQLLEPPQPLLALRVDDTLAVDAAALQGAVHGDLRLRELLRGGAEDGDRLAGQCVDEHGEPVLASAGQLGGQREGRGDDEGALGVVIDRLPNTHDARAPLAQSTKRLFDEDAPPAPLLVPMPPLLLRDFGARPPNTARNDVT